MLKQICILFKICENLFEFAGRGTQIAPPPFTTIAGQSNSISIEKVTYHFFVSNVIQFLAFFRRMYFF